MIVSEFPLISQPEFDEACQQLEELFARKGNAQDDWLSVTVKQQYGTKYLKITKALRDIPAKREPDEEPDTDEMIEEDDEALSTHSPHDAQAILEYDIILSASYRVPVLYIGVKDTLLRYPITAETIPHIVPSHFQAQVSEVGAMGAITGTDHPVTNLPVFFIHPCRTMTALEACASSGLDSLQYLKLWMGIVGCCVGLSVPSCLAIEDSY